MARVTVKEDADAILPCSLGTSETIESMVFDWKKDGKQVFTYNNGTHHNNDLEDQSAEFKGRVSHFPEELKNGNASIKITDTRLEDKGNYICIFPKSQSGDIRFHIELAVGECCYKSAETVSTHIWQGLIPTVHLQKYYQYLVNLLVKHLRCPQVFSVFTKQNKSLSMQL